MVGSFSPIISDWYDFAISISGPPELDYAMPAVSSSLLVFLCTMEDACRNVVEEYGVSRLKPGDVLICNDPYRNGRHVNDVCFIRPVFYRDKLTAFVNVCAHQLDMGGIVPGGFSASKANVFETGLVMGPTLLFENDEMVRRTMSLVFDNTRFGELLRADFMTMFEQLQLGERLVGEIIERYGLDAFTGTVRYCCDASAETMRDAFEALPDGVYETEDYIDADGAGDDEELTVRAKVVKAHGRVEVDLSGSSRQARTCINAGPLDAKTAIGAVFKILFDRSSPFTSGAYRHIDVVVPPGTVLSAMPPDGAIMLYWEVTQTLLCAMLRELGRAMGDVSVGGDYGAMSVHNAHGVRPDGTPWSNVVICGGEHGPWGADKDHDGDSYTLTYMVNAIDPPTETMEQDSPVLMMRKEYVQDTGGPGQNRGGAAVIKDALWLEPGEHHTSPLRYKHPTGFGTNGGQPGKLGAAWFFDPETVPENALLAPDATVYRASTPLAGMLNPETKAPDPDGEFYYFARQPIWRTRAGAMTRYMTNGGGGWGDVLARDPERVLADVRNGYASLEHAREAYGVVINGDPDRDPEGLVLDRDATRALRGRIASR
jgi:N-methylhydantoinase B